MKNDIIEQLYFGNIDPSALTFDQHSEFGQAMDTLTEAEEHIGSVLSEADNPFLKSSFRRSIPLMRQRHRMPLRRASDWA